MPISPIINSPAALYALMTTTDTADLAQSYTQTANIDMSTYGFDSKSIAGTETSTPYDFSGTYDGGNFTITIGSNVTDWTGLFDTVATSGVIRNVNLIYNSALTLTVSGTNFNNKWGGLVGGLDVASIINCSVTFNNSISLSTTASNIPIGLLCGFMAQESTLTNSTVTINNTISIDGETDNVIGLLCGLAEDSIITDCSIVATSGTYNITLKAKESTDSDIGLVCGYFGVDITSLTPPLLRNITVSLSNTGGIILDSDTSGQPINKGAICGTVIGDATDITIIENCTININNNQTLTGAFSDFFGQVISNTQVSGCQFNYTTTTNNTSRPLTISPTPTVAPVIYTNSFTNVYSLTSDGNYYIPNNNAIIALGLSPITLVKSSSAIIINGALQSVGTIYSSSTGNYNYIVIVKGVGSMYFGFNYSGIPGNIIDTPIECICQINSCSTNPQTGISGDSRITNTIQDKTIRANVDREFATKSVVYPKFKSYSDYMKYLQAGLNY